VASSETERQLILLSAGTSARRDEMRRQAQRLIAELDWSRLADALRARRLLTTLGPRIVDLADGHASDAFALQVEQAVDAARRQCAVLQLVSLRVIAALADAGIRASTLKGPMMAEMLYGDPGRRLSGDIDLLVDPVQIHDAVELVRGLGYGAPTDNVDSDGLPLLHFALVHEQGLLPPIELHWRVHWYERSFASARLLPPDTLMPDEWRPSAVDELVALLLFYARDGFVDVRLATDLGAWWDAFGEELPARALDEPLRSYPELARAISVAVRVAGRVVGLPVAHILGTRQPHVRDRLAARLANPNPSSSAQQLYADIGLIDGLLGPAGSFGAFMRRQVLVPRHVLDERARRVARQRGRSSVAHSVGTLLRYGRTMTRLAQAPETLRGA
jgi:hypothetical protein